MTRYPKRYSRRQRKALRARDIARPRLVMTYEFVGPDDPRYGEAFGGFPVASDEDVDTLRSVGRVDEQGAADLKAALGLMAYLPGPAGRLARMLEAMSAFVASATYEEAELDEMLRAEGIDPDAAVDAVLRRVRVST